MDCTRFASIVALAGAAALLAPSALRAATLVVDADGLASAADCAATTSAYSTIQSAVDAAAAGDTILVCPGTYDEQITINKNNLRVRGAGASLTVVRPSMPLPRASALVSRVPVSVTPIVMVRDATGVSIEQMAVDGAGTAHPASNFDCGAWPQFVGIYMRNGSGSMNAVRVTRMRSPTLCSYGVRTESAGGGSSKTIISTSLFDLYGDAAISCLGFATDCTVKGSALRGDGPLETIAQTGMIVRRGANAVIAGNTITGNFWAPKFRGIAGKAVGIFLVNANPDANPHLLRDNVFADNELDVQRVQTAEVVD